MNVLINIIDGPVAGVSACAAEGAGAALTFLGVVRPTEDGRPISGLHYQAYQPMAEKILRQIAEAAGQRFALLSVELTHSRGFVPAGSVSLRIMVSSKHRAEALAALAWILDGLKRDVPIWKTAQGLEKHGMHAAPEARVVAVNTSAGGIPKRPVAEARLNFDGMEGDLHEHEKHRRPDRAISIQDVELIEELQVEGYAVGPGLMGENLTVKDLHVQSLEVGDRLEFDSGAVLELTSVRKPCFVLDQIDPALKEAVVGRCGFMAKVVTTGVLRPGQRIVVQQGAVASAGNSPQTKSTAS